MLKELLRQVALATAVIGLSGCARHLVPRPAGPCDKGPSAAKKQDIRFPLAGTGKVVDTEDAVFPDPRERTWIHVDALRTLVRRYVRDHGALTLKLEEVSSLRRDLPLLWDGWGYAIFFTRSGNEYEIRAAGADGRYCTRDDLVATEDHLPPYVKRSRTF